MKIRTSVTSNELGDFFQFFLAFSYNLNFNPDLFRKHFDFIDKKFEPIVLSLDRKLCKLWSLLTTLQGIS